MRRGDPVRDSGRMKKNAETVQQIYAAFGRGDIPAILETLGDDVEWEHHGASSDVPWLQERRGRASVGGFFEAVGKHLDITHFVVKDILEGPNVVVALVDINATVKDTGRSYSEVDEAHIWRFDDRGQVAKFRHAVDTHAHVLAWKR